MIFQRGFRLRTELYSQAFHHGIIKTTEVILYAIKSLDAYKNGPEPEKMIPDGENLWKFLEGYTQVWLDLDSCATMIVEFA